MAERPIPAAAYVKMTAHELAWVIYFLNVAAELLGDMLDRGCPAEAATEAKGLRRALFWKAFLRAPGEMIWCQIQHWWVEFQHHLRPAYPWVAILGPDGSGKSTVIEDDDLDPDPEPGDKPASRPEMVGAA